MDTEEIEVFLTLAEELHFGRTALRLRLPQPRVSRLVATLERRVGGTLFERTSRSVRLTPAGERLRDELLPAYDQMRAALRHASETARQAAGVLTIGFTATSCSEALSRTTGAFERGNPGCQAVLREVDMFDPYSALRGGEVDVLFTWLAVDEPDLSAGPAIEFRARVLLVAPGHPLAARESVGQEDLGDWDLIMCPPMLPRAFYDTLIPPRTPSGKPTRRAHPVHTINEIVTLVSLGRVVHPTCASVPLYQRDDVAAIPIRDMPPVGIGPIWCTAREDARIRALVRAAR
jgi:DNA-binding transcriptional LysR family regulator